MKNFEKFEDGLIETLFREHRESDRNAVGLCEAYDPDLANAYVERRLTSQERNHYETHLFDCTQCRTAAVTLHRFAQAESPERVIRLQASGGVLPGLREAARYLGGPRLAVSLSALFVVIFGLTSVLRYNTPVTDQAGNETGASIFEAGPSVETPEADLTEVERLAVAVALSDARSDERIGFEAGPVEVGVSPPAFSRVDPSVLPAESERLEPGVMLASSIPPAPVPPAEPLPVIDPSETLRLPEEGERSAQMTTLKPGFLGSEPRSGRTIAGTIRPEDGSAPAAESTAESTRPRAITQGSGNRALRDGSDASPPRNPTQRRILNKRFWFLNGVWTDRDHNPTKEMPVVTLERGTEVYGEVLSKNPELGSYLNHFNETDSVVIVFKKTVYKFEPKTPE